MKVVFCNKLNRAWMDNIEALGKEFPDARFVTKKEGMDGEIEDAEAIVGGELPLHVIQRAKNLKIIFVPYAGMDAVPLDDIKARGIRIANVHVNAPFVAERCIAMALAFYGRIIDYHNDLKKNRQWHGYWATGSIKDTWNSIQGRSCAVIGTGAIGTNIAKYLKIFGCPIIGFKKRSVEGTLKYFDQITLNFTKALEKSELVFVALPLTIETKGLFSAQVLSGMKGKFLVNVGRGEVVDEEGLYLALKDGTLKGAAIDAWYNYPGEGETRAEPSKYPISDLPNVVLSPHLAGFTPQVAMKIIEGTIDNIRAYLKTGRAETEMNPALMY